VNVRIRRVAAPLHAPWRTAHGEIGERELVLVALADDQGWVGLGEAAPLASYDGVTTDDVQAALEDCSEVLRRAEEAPHDELLADCARLAVLPQAVAAIDLALWDLAGRRANAPVWRLLGADTAPQVEVNHTISVADRSGAGSEAAEARGRGYRCLKAKVGIGDDAGRLAAIRAAAGPDMAIRIDANGIWTVDEAAAALDSLRPIGIELCEEPVKGIDEITRLTELTDIPLALDESSSLPGALDRRACAAVCLKLTGCGGISGLIAAAARARSVGYEVYLASTLDGPLGIAAALHAAAVISPDRACGLATLGLFEGRSDPLPAGNGRISAPDAPGLGAPELRAWYHG
jgi:L-alanine-DL-glutamate epimerase-like enolase superfamily enzyme